MRWAIRRLIHAALLLLAVSALCFLFAELAPGDFFSDLRNDPRISNETIDTLRSRAGAGEPFVVQYALWIRGLLHGELGYSLAYHVRVGALLAPRILNTLLLTTTSLALSWLIAVILGTIAAAARGGWFDSTTTAVATLVLCLPDVVLALAVVQWGTSIAHLPAGGMSTLDGGTAASADPLRDVARHLLLPVAALVIGSVPLLMRHVRASVSDVLDAPHVRAAVALGIPRRRLLWRFVLPAAANPLVSLLGLAFGGLLSASLIVEVVMSWPGLGPLFLQAILARDRFVVTGAVMLSALMFVAGQCVADLLLVVVDPRVRQS